METLPTATFVHTVAKTNTGLNPAAIQCTELLLGVNESSA